MPVSPTVYFIRLYLYSTGNFIKSFFPFLKQTLRRKLPLSPLQECQMNFRVHSQIESKHPFTFSLTTFQNQGFEAELYL